MPSRVLHDLVDVPVRSAEVLPPGGTGHSAGGTEQFEAVPGEVVASGLNVRDQESHRRPGGEVEVVGIARSEHFDARRVWKIESYEIALAHPDGQSQRLLEERDRFPKMDRSGSDPVESEDLHDGLGKQRGGRVDSRLRS